LVVDRQKQMV